MKSLLVIVILALAPASAANQVLLRYLDTPDQAVASLIADDGTGHLFSVSVVNVNSPHGLVRVLKLDRNGTPLAQFDFGDSQSIGPVAAAMDAQGNLVIVGSTYASGFPVVSPLGESGGGGTFVPMAVIPPKQRWDYRPAPRDRF